MSGDRARRGVTLALGLVLLLAAVARFYGLDYHSLRNDELSSWNRSNHQSFADMIEHGVRPDPHPPGFQSLLWVIERYVGDSETVMRAPSAVAGLLAVLFTFLLGRRLFGDREGLTAAALMALSVTPIYYSQDARAYAYLLCCAVASSYFLWPLIRDLARDGPADTGALTGFVLVSAASCYLHYFGVVLFGTQVAYLLGVTVLGGRWSRLWIGLAAVAAVALLYLPWWNGFYEDLTAREAPEWFNRPGKAFAWRYLQFGLSRSWLLAALALGLMGFLLAAELRRIWTNRSGFSLFAETRTPDFFVAYWFLGPFALAVLKSYVSEPVTSLRNLVILLPALYLLVARGVARLPLSPRLQTAAAVALVAFTAYRLLFGVDYYSSPQKHQFREAVQHVIAHEAQWPDAPVVGFAFSENYFNYYFERLNGRSRVSLIAGESSDIERMSAMLATGRPPAFWYLAATRTPAPAFLDYLGSEYELREERLFYGASARLYTRE